MEIDLESLRSGIMGLTPEYGAFLLQACTVCLDHHNHQSGVDCEIDGEIKATSQLKWSSVVSKTVRKNWADLQEATEYGATALALCLANEIADCACIERSSKGTGFDYWLGDEDAIGLFQRKERLEISGILSESETNKLNTRVKAKIQQTQVSKGQGNAHICVSEFSLPKVQYLVTK